MEIVVEELEKRIEALEARLGAHIEPPVGKDTYGGEIEWKDELFDFDYQPENWQGMTLEEKIEDIRLRLKALMKATGYPIDKLFSNIQAEKADVYDPITGEGIKI